MIFFDDGFLTELYNCSSTKFMMMAVRTCVLLIRFTVDVHSSTHDISQHHLIFSSVIQILKVHAPYLLPVDVINTHNHTLTWPRHVKGMSPPGVAENNQIILSGDTSC